jgi:hypothetical protein
MGCSPHKKFLESCADTDAGAAVAQLGAREKGSLTFSVELVFTLALTADVISDFMAAPEESCFTSRHPLKTSRKLSSFIILPSAFEMSLLTSTATSLRGR